MAITTFKQLQEEFAKVFIIADDGILKLLMATIIGNQLSSNAIWIMIVGASASGKSEYISSLNKLDKIICPISDLTVNTLASGSRQFGKETSLLHKLPIGAVFAFKDFTSMVSKNREAKTEILAQLREVYDGEFVKRTGTGDDIKWKGKVGAIAGSTEVVFEHLEDLSAMGDRFILYSMKMPDRMEVARRVLFNSKDMGEKRDHLQNCVKEFIDYTMSKMVKDVDLVLSHEVEERLLQVADFSTKVRSGVIMDERNKSLVRFVPSSELPTRVTGQFYALARGFIAMGQSDEERKVKKGELTDEEIAILYQIAFDSIPIKRRMALHALAKYKGGVATKGLATSLNYQTVVVNGWMAQLNSLGICHRVKKGNSDVWSLNEKYRKIISEYEHINPVEESLEDDEIPEIDEDFGDFTKAAEEYDQGFNQIANQ